MKATDFIFIGVKGSVAAIQKCDGQIVWSTKLTGGQFVALTHDERWLFAHTDGVLYCLDLWTGSIQWKNELKGYGFGLASICVPGFPSTPDAATIAYLEAQQAAAANSAAHS